MNLHIHIVVGVLIAALGGLAVGLERERSAHAVGTQARFAGVRTFTLLGGLSGLCGWLWIQDYRTPAGVFLSGAVALIVVAYAAASRRDIDSTTEVAALVVVAAGFTAGIGGWALAGGIVTVTTLLLVEKSRLHEIAGRLDDTALRAGVRFGVMAVVILPLLPEGPFGPWGGIRPRTLWLAVLLFSGLSFLGYLARRTSRSSSGYSVAGMLGGVISSTAVAFSFSRLSSSERSQGSALALGVIGASTVLFLRVAIAVTVLNSGLARVSIPLFVLPFVIGAAVMVVGIWRTSRTSKLKDPETGNPLQFWTSLQMVGIFQCMFYLVYGLNQVWGNRGLLASGAIVGLTDVDALAISMSRGGDGANLDLMSRALVIGILSNTALKIGIVLALGRGSFRWLAVAGLALISVTLAISLLLF